MKSCIQIGDSAKNTVYRRSLFNGLNYWDICLDFSSRTRVQHQIKSAPILDVAVMKGAAAVPQQLALKDEDEALFVGRDALLDPDLGLHGVDGVEE